MRTSIALKQISGSKNREKGRKVMNPSIALKQISGSRNREKGLKVMNPFGDLNSRENCYHVTLFKISNRTVINS